MKMNLIRSWQKLEALLAANFTEGICTWYLHTMTTICLQAVAEAVKLLKKLIRLLREHRKARGRRPGIFM